ncbi:hypothetical protein [Virgisporangium aliadipatigenens]|uniref:hypothetical protein n=1 Tax=Virgisporangium aliadipatigenens TaxID=741659 RepID=UPI0023B21A3F|nr:hypothetical protein [Virgisporangium aliadipatigenens]
MRVVGVPSLAELTALFRRCDDVVVEHGAQGCCATVRFDRTAAVFTDALVSGVRDLEEVGLRPVCVSGDDDPRPSWRPASEALAVEAVNLVLRLRTIAPRVERWGAVRSLLTGRDAVRTARRAG